MSYSIADAAGIIIGALILGGSAVILVNRSAFASWLLSVGRRMYGGRVADVVFEPAYTALAAVLGVALGAFMVVTGAIGAFA